MVRTLLTCMVVAAMFAAVPACKNKDAAKSEVGSASTAADTNATPAEPAPKPEAPET